MSVLNNKTNILPIDLAEWPTRRRSADVPRDIKDTVKTRIKKEVD